MTDPYYALGQVSQGTGIHNESSVSIGPLGLAKVYQRVALVDFDPGA